MPPSFWLLPSSRQEAPIEPPFVMLCALSRGPPGEVVEPGEWAKAKELIAAGTDINYEGVGGSLDFDDVGDVSGFFGKFIVEDGGYKETGVFQ